MNRNPNRITTALLTAGLLGALLFTTLPTHAKAAESCPTNPCNLDARLTARADQSFASLRSFVIRTRMIHQLDVTEALERVERYRQTHAKA